MQAKSLLLLFVLFPLCLQAEDFTVCSPNGRLKATVTLSPEGKLSYSVSRDERLVVDESPLGLKLGNADLTEGLELTEARNDTVDDSYTLPVGKRSLLRDHCHALSLLTKKGTWQFEVRFRIYDDGFAFRYAIPRKGHTTALLIEEASRIRVAGIRSTLACPFLGNKGNNPNYPYEGLYTNYTDWTTLREAGDARLNSPTLVSNGTDFLLISEADCRGIFCTSLNKAEEQEGEFSYSWTGATKDYAEDKAHRISCPLPFLSPWRMVVCGDIKTVFETTLTENLCPPTQQTDLSWIKPGVASWYWGGSDGNKDEIREALGGLRQGEWLHCQLAAEMGWPYHLIDAGWDESWFPSFVDEANQKGVDCLLWRHAHSSDLTNENMNSTLKKWSQWGIKGIKIDFWEDDSRETMTHMENLYKAAAKHKMLVNLHGCTRPSGLRRTYPHIMTQEGIYGGEQNFWHSRNNTTLEHLAVLFTRNVVGAMDYTPGDFATWRGSILTQRSMGHHMALLTLFESGIVHIAESPHNLRYFLGRDIMKRLPVSWDESLLIEGDPQKYATVARRKGTDWWLSGISVNERTARLKLDFLEEGTTYTAYIYRDGTCRSDLKFEKKQLSKGKTLSLKELSEGGFLVQLSPDANLDVPLERTTYEAEATANTITGSTRRQTYSSLHASAGGYVGYLGNGGKLQFNRVKASHSGDYILTIYYIAQDTRPAKLLVNGEQVGDTIVFESNGDCTKSWDPDGMGWKMLPVKLVEGNRNTITIQSFDDQWAPNFDRITLHPVLSDEEVTAIGHVPQAQSLGPDATACFDLQGRRLPLSAIDKGSRNEPRIIIRDGKKVVCK